MFAFKMIPLPYMMFEDINTVFGACVMFIAASRRYQTVIHTYWSFFVGVTNKSLESLITRK